MYPTTISTPRLVMHLNDLSSDEDTNNIIRTFNDKYIGQFGFRHLGVNTPADVAAKCQRHGAKPELCTKLSSTTPPPSIFFMVHLKTTGEYIGFMGISFRSEMPYPDLGYALFEPFNGQGYASEAASATLNFWRDEIGVKDIFVATYETNVASRKLARRIGFVDAGEFTIDFGGAHQVTGAALVLPHMTWPNGVVIRPTINPTKKQRDAELAES